MLELRGLCIFYVDERETGKDGIRGFCVRQWKLLRAPENPNPGCRTTLFPVFPKNWRCTNFRRQAKVSNPWENTDLSKILKIECGSVDVPVFEKTVFFWGLCGVLCAFTKHSAKNKNFARLNMWAQKQEKKGVRGRRFGTSGSAS